MTTKKSLLEQTIEKMVKETIKKEGTLRGPQSGGGATSKPSVKVPPPRELGFEVPKDEPIGTPSAGYLSGLLTQLENALGQEDLSPDIKNQIERAKAALIVKIGGFSKGKGNNSLSEQILADVLESIWNRGGEWQETPTKKPKVGEDELENARRLAQARDDAKRSEVSKDISDRNERGRLAAIEFEKRKKK